MLPVGRVRACARLFRMRLHSDWLRILRRSWSLRLSILAALFGAADVACSFLPRDGAHRMAFGALATFFALAAAIARPIAQTNLRGSE